MDDSLGPPPPVAGRAYPTNIEYWFTNIMEWFAEIWATRVITNLRSGEVEVYVSDSSPENRYKPPLIHYVCGGNSTL